MRIAEAARQNDWERKLVAYSNKGSKATGPMVSATAFALKNMHSSPEWGEQREQPPTPEQHQHIHLHMTARQASDAYQQMLRED
jgi:hypothetical protein